MDDSRPCQFRLTKREWECAWWISRAASNAEVGRRMSIQTKTVENKLNLIFRKMEFQHNPRVIPRVQLARWVWTHPEERTLPRPPKSRW